ncbi:MAG: Fur family transcriptional regulator [Deinococcales bacterium]
MKTFLASFMMKHSSQSLRSLRQILKEHGLRYSKPRATILRIFSEKHMHISAEGLYLELKQRGEALSLSTVYLNLGALRDAGLIREILDSNGEAVYDSNITPHYHLICRECRTIVDIPIIALAQTPLGQALQQHTQAHANTWQVDEPDVILHGLCPNCKNVKAA